jgi:peptidoglycan/LPS O-acetylase OafA/YrhL
MRSVDALTVGRDNDFNLLRMIAASAVLISHAYPIAAGVQTIEPLTTTLLVSLETLAVLTFFAISGFFISESPSQKYISLCRLFVASGVWTPGGEM